jgi:uncharacterized Zn finger protein (UPF0148 family)
MNNENEGKKWSEDDLVKLQKYYPMYGSEYCAELLRRNKKAIIARASKSKLKFTGVRYKYSKEYIEPIVKVSRNIKDLLQKMELRAAGGNYRVIKEYIKKYSIDISHFEKPGTNLNSIERRFVAIPIESVLIENSNYSRSRLKYRLYELGLKNRNCELCGQGEEWRGKHMSLILDHVNGVYNDNRLENLRIVCPNCNATFETHAGKNTHKKTNKDKLLQQKKELKNTNKTKLIEQKTTDGRNRPGVERRKANRPPLEQLKKEIQELGYSATGRKYGVSDNAIRKWVKSYEKYNI